MPRKKAAVEAAEVTAKKTARKPRTKKVPAAEEVVEKVEEKVEKAVEVAAEEAKEVPAKKTARKPRAKKAPAKTEKIAEKAEKAVEPVKKAARKPRAAKAAKSRPEKSLFSLSSAARSHRKRSLQRSGKWTRYMSASTRTRPTGSRETRPERSISGNLNTIISDCHFLLFCQTDRTIIQQIRCFRMRAAGLLFLGFLCRRHFTAGPFRDRIRIDNG